MYEIRIWVLNIYTNKREKPTKYNTFFDEYGTLQGIQNNLKIEYEIKLFDTQD